MDALSIATEALLLCFLLISACHLTSASLTSIGYLSAFTPPALSIYSTYLEVSLFQHRQYHSGWDYTILNMRNANSRKVLLNFQTIMQRLCEVKYLLYSDDVEILDLEMVSWRLTYPLL